MSQFSTEQLDALARALKLQARTLGFQDCAITLPDAHQEAEAIQHWLDKGYQGSMDYLTQNVEKRLDPTLLVPGTQRIIMLRMDYLPAGAPITGILRNPDKAYVARYTLGRDYHKLIRKRLKQLGQWLDAQVEGAEVRFRPFVDSAPVLERPLARNAGLGWIGKHTLLLNRQAGSWFLLGELFIDLPLPIDPPETESHCGRCSACIDICPTQAFPEPGVLDARRCISYLTIEHRGSIPPELRPLMGNRIFGCDDCQLICPWNRFAKRSDEPDFQPRHGIDQAGLLELFAWDEETFLKRTEGSAIRRTGYEGWQRNLAVALGNSRGGDAVTKALQGRREQSSALVQEHIDWALQQLRNAAGPSPLPILDHPGARRLPE
ncbi:MAG: tRNA epoxyqueuosine(34) reductase QueG [Oceanospirillales bacterium]|uniref:Epoxyqueuosine reductase n=1 Tax=Marinobacterium halophilum TaxID=267374 RepID=A0A2P8F3P4_9GAMM|nr:tRNA epoxyqueuosine(34) reductase QueG [Marinobacterium halophilum]MBR9829253.1 tRNA epoxyqueuosine(34) reductase QueG [Oceanospirillales bacterium]PSL16322.1 epoxyqueuosine reductase [Marinobacterium halophilum]